MRDTQNYINMYLNKINKSYLFFIGGFLFLLLVNVKINNGRSDQENRQGRDNTNMYGLIKPQNELPKSVEVIPDLIQHRIDKEEVQYQSWLDQDHCDLSVNLKKPSQSLKLPYVALASLQGSGNTWTRHLFHVYTGLVTGSLYNDPALVNSTEFKMSKPVLGNNNFQNYIKRSPYADKLTYKWHEYPNNKNFNIKSGRDKVEFSKVVLIVRNPFDAVVSQAIRVGTRKYFRDNLGMTKEEAEIKAKTARLDLDIIKTMEGLKQENLKRSLNKWLAMVVEWLKVETNSGNSIPFPLCYDLLKDPTTQVQEMFKATEFIGLPKNDYPEHHKGDCLMKESEGSFHRKPKTYTSLDLFGEEAAKLGFRHISEASKVLVEMGLDDCTAYFKYDRA